jgi:hypothetical protein
VAINFFSRVGNITNSYRADENWERELFIESSSFAAGAGFGSITASIGALAISFVMAATPVGWVGLVIIGGTFLATAAVSVGVSMAVDRGMKNNMGFIYDEIIDGVYK